MNLACSHGSFKYLSASSIYVKILSDNEEETIFFFFLLILKVFSEGKEESCLLELVIV